ncbi:unnamed protein product [Orchesella dallaii]|uniref:CCHC-type domain-containing protein n=1 Tax=Orchesella dallaii TaxID=48710 RepID=A0ABP1PXB8_9HEXA
MTEKPKRVAVIPKTFSGSREQDPEKHLKQYERAAACNHWDEATKLLYFPVYLDGTATLWYENFEKKLKDNGVELSWLIIPDAFKKGFTTIARADVAERKLHVRKQHVGESAEDYVYEIVDLCRKVDNNMPEDRIVRTTIKGLRPAFLDRINLMQPNTINEVLECIRKVQETKFLVDCQTEQSEVIAVSREDNEMKNMINQLNENLAKQTDAVTKLIEKLTMPQQPPRACYNCGLTNHIARNCIRPRINQPRPQQYNNQNYQQPARYQPGNENQRGQASSAPLQQTPQRS